MFKQFVLVSLLVSGMIFISENTFAELSMADVSAVTNCGGTQVIRVAPGKFEVQYIEENLPGCVGKTSSITDMGNSASTTIAANTSEVVVTHEVTNCSGLRLTTLSNGRYTSAHVEVNLPGCIDTTSKNAPLETPHINLSHGPLLDLASTEIVSYRNELLKKQGIRFANAVRSVRMRALASMQSRTNAYLMNGDAVVISGKETGWMKVRGTNLVVADIHENIVKADTKNRASGYTASKYLRNPNASDLVRIEQADHAYWSDIAHTKVAHLVNVRSHPWYTSSIVTTIQSNVNLYIVRTVDNWSEVRNDSGTIHGYIRSDFLVVDHAQRVDNPNTEKNVSLETSSDSSIGDSSWIAF